MTVEPGNFRNLFLAVAVAHTKLTFLRKKVLGLMKNTICILHQNNIVMLANANSRQRLSGQRLSEIKNWLKDSKMVAGISDDCFDLKAIRKSYVERCTYLILQ